MLLNEDVYNSEHIDNDLKSSPKFSVFNIRNWRAVIEDTYQFTTFLIALFTHGKPTTILPITEIKHLFRMKKGVSLPYSDYYHLITRNDGEYQEIIEEAVRLGKERNWNYFEYRGGEIFGYDYTLLQKYYLHTIDISQNINVLEKNLKKRAIRKLKDAQNYGISFHISKDINEVKKFYLLHCLTRKRHGLPPQPYKFFDMIYKNLLQNGHGFIAMAIFEKEIISAQIYLNAGTHCIYKYGASNQKGLDLSASYLIMWESIKYLKGSNIKSLSLGRTAIDNNGLVYFKDSWGAKREDLIYTKIYYKKINKQKIKYLPVAKLFFKHSPIFLLKIIGKILYPFLG